MSIQTQIDRIQTNVSSALTAIADKGVTVPDGSTSDALAELIAAIEAGGLPEGIAAMTSGVYILSSAATTAEIEHGLGMTPDFFFMSGNTSGAIYYAVNDYFSLSDCILYKAIRRNEEIFSGLAPSETIFTDSTVSLSVSTAKFNAGVNYTWYAGVFA